MKIKVLSNYASRFKDQPVSYGAGVTIEVDRDLAEFLYSDSPASFEFPEGFKPAGPGYHPAKGMPSPPEDKMIDAGDLESKKVKELREIAKAKGLQVSGNKKTLLARILGR
jgi:hypothetical protein